MKNSQKLGGIKKLQQNSNHEDLVQQEQLCQELKDEIIQILRMDADHITVMDSINALRSEDFIESHKAIIKLRRTLANFEQEIAKENELIPILFHIIQYGSTYLLKLEAACCLYFQYYLEIISILAGGRSEITRIIMENGILQLSMSVLDGNQSELIMLIITILGKLAGESVKYRDSILQACSMDKIISKIESKYKSIYIWCLANLCIGRPSPKFDKIQSAFEIFAQVIMEEFNQQNLKMINDAIWALGYMIDGEPNRIAALINSGVVPQLINLLPMGNFVSILRIFECIFYGTEDQIKYLLECGFIAHIRMIVDPKSRDKSGDMIQTFAATETLFKVLSNQNFLVSLFRSLSDDNQNLRGDALEVIGNAIQQGTNEDVGRLVGNGLIQYLLSMLEIANEKEIASIHLKKGLEILIKIIRKGEIKAKDNKSNQFFIIFVKLDGVSVIQKLLSYKQDDVAKYALLFKQEFDI
ncbi:unnamed protein product (macronuclear) [Paramecium tetraurelia]|uniref:Importin subunit alpha n=1 Tax=Paramecium tetraurelia TaxID=5888 RepID=A0C423_PARTE|nr:uncharacterized protein GSPATT00035020001 [Paramecium tetraurelia]CAK65540.1 unnamed protein product [Paramecium tetraurelia]|eukprot:XP_001432937.1 hypothetical protein (macronuclear) [Paramecium tetraurelia strain d4-2]